MQRRKYQVRKQFRPRCMTGEGGAVRGIARRKYNCEIRVER